ncbi:hypothetical protein HMPREF9582_02364 [Cutibacterium acnes HL060PA1]|nr:hypothetical protein HMPREF9582_02364 [Cutibacterium acnes HL060PA1]EGE70475.1 hypothetical protein HMPREF9341_00182 [Cutibacterium acnes HL103PA1]
MIGRSCVVFLAIRFLSSCEHLGDDNVYAAAIDLLDCFGGQSQGDFSTQRGHPVALLLDIGVPAAFGVTLGVRDVVAEFWLGAADLTAS